MNASLSTLSADGGNRVVVRVNGHFGFALYKQFREMCATASPKQEYVVDLAGASYMDSSALGMLLLLREHAGGEKAKIEITNCQPNVLKILSIAKFDSMFMIRSQS